MQKRWLVQCTGLKNCVHSLIPLRYARMQEAKRSTELHRPYFCPTFYLNNYVLSKLSSPFDGESLRPTKKKWSFLHFPHFFDHFYEDNEVWSIVSTLNKNAPAFFSPIIPQLCHASINFFSIVHEWLKMFFFGQHLAFNVFLHHLCKNDWPKKKELEPSPTARLPTPVQRRKRRRNQHVTVTKSFCERTLRRVLSRHSLTSKRMSKVC